MEDIISVELYYLLSFDKATLLYGRLFSPSHHVISFVILFCHHFTNELADEQAMLYSLWEE